LLHIYNSNISVCTCGGGNLFVARRVYEKSPRYHSSLRDSSRQVAT